MKLQAYELPIGKQSHPRRKTPKIAPLLLILTLCLTIIPIYYPALRYNFKKLSEPVSNSFDSTISPIDDQSVSKFEEKEIIKEAVGKLDELNGEIDDSKEITGGSDTGDRFESEIVNESRSDEYQRNRDEKFEQYLNIEEKAILEEAKEKIDEFAGIDGLSSAKAYQVSNADEKVDLGDESQEGAISHQLITGIVNESESNESTRSSNSNENVDNESKSDESTSNSEIAHELRRYEAPEVRKRTGRKGRRRSGHRKKDPQIKNAEIQPPEHDESGSITTTRTDGIHPQHEQNSDVTGTGTINSNNEVESKVIIKEIPISSSSSSCDLFTGEWIPNPEGPYYTNETCWAIQEHQNCLKFGRPDRDYLKWRWKPDECELPIFDPSQFLQLVRGKSLAFVGDSVARNHMQSLICLLSRVVYPEDLSKSINDQNRLYLYKDYNFTISMFWSPYLIKTELTEQGNVTRPFNLYLDEPDPNWTTKISNTNYIIISAGQWFMRPTYFYEKQKIVGCLYCPSSENIPYKTSHFSYRRAFRTSLKAINNNNNNNFNGIIYLRTFAPSHFEGGAWDRGGKCSRISPFKRNETILEDYAQIMYKIQLEEFDIAKRECRRRRRRKGLMFRLFDSTKSMLLRPDGHPSKYGHWPEQKVELPEDCVHWCLPGPIDSWNDFLLELFKRDQEDIATQ